MLISTALMKNALFARDALFDNGPTSFKQWGQSFSSYKGDTSRTLWMLGTCKKE